MGDFETRKKNYEKMLTENSELVLNICSNTKDSKLLEIILDPKNEQDLDYAESAVMIFIDLMRLIQGVVDEQVKEIDVEDSISLKLYIDIINAQKNNDQEKIEEIKEHLKCNMDIKETAILTYEMMTVLAQNPEESMEYIIDNCGFDVDNSLDLARFQLHMTKAGETINSCLNGFDAKSFNPNDESQVKALVEYANAFHALVEDGLDINSLSL